MRKTLEYASAAVIGCAALFLFYVDNWQSRHTYELKGQIKSATPFRMKNDAHMDITGKEVVIAPEDDPGSETRFDVASSVWDDTAREGDMATFRVYPGFFTGNIRCDGMDDGK
jgi:hypothetical protein